MQKFGVWAEKFFAKNKKSALRPANFQPLKLDSI